MTRIASKKGGNTINDYRITYTTEAGDSQYSTTTERTEAAARKYFNTMNKGLGFTITSVELIRENTCATKQQERDTLAAIKKMVEELGPQSYLATAFEGCFEDAEQNIENDWGCSQKQLADAAAQKVTELEAKVAELESDIGLLTSALENERALTKSLEQRLVQQTISADDLTDISRLLTDKVLELGKEVSNAAQRIVENADQPGGAMFQDAVKDHRAAQADLGYYTALLTKVNSIKNAGQDD